MILLRTDFRNPSSNNLIRRREGRKSSKRGNSKGSSQSQSMTLSWYTSIFGTLFTRTTTQRVGINDEEDGNGQFPDQRDTRSERTFVFVPSFLSHSVEVRFVNSFGWIQHSLRTYPLLPDDHPVWEMCGEGDLQSLQTLLGDRTISPFSVNSFGRSLLHVSSGAGKSTPCKLLISYRNPHFGTSLKFQTFSSL